MLSVKALFGGVSCFLVCCILLPEHQGGASESSLTGGRALSLKDPGIPLATEFYDGGMRLLLDVQAQGLDGAWLPKQRVLLDTGSSTLAFCDRQLIVTAKYEASNFVSCNEYNSYGGHFSGYWGPFVTGNILVGHESWNMSSYSIMVQQKLMPCTEGFHGIFGIAFRELDPAFPTPQMATDKFSCPENSSHVLTPPLMKQLSRESSPKIGILWGTKKEGRLYMGQAAVDNEHYAESEDYAMAAELVELGFYGVEVQTISVGDETFNVTCDPASSPCVMDTGTPTIVLPQDVYEATVEQNGTLVLELAASNSSINSINLTFDMGLLNTLGWITKGNKHFGLVLGLPLWAFYYTVFDINAKQAVFVPLPEAGLPSRLLQPTLLI